MKKHSVTVVFIVFILLISLLLVLLPKTEYSENEKRVLAQFPEFSFSSVFSGQFGQELETYIADHFPMRDLFVGVQAYTEQILGQNGKSGIYAGKDGYLLATPIAVKEEQVARNVNLLAQFSQKTGLPTVIMPVPTAGYILQDKLPINHEKYPDDRIYEILQENAGEMKIVDLRETFLAEKEDLYYRTDHHLTAAGAYRMYQAYCKATERHAVSYARKERYTGFYGTGYSKSGLWLKEADVLEVWKPEAETAYKVTVTDGSSVKESDSLYFPEHLRNADKYPIYLDGNHALVTIENEKCENGKKLLLIKDSYAHCFATYAISGYEEICMVDMRYYRDSVSELVEERGLNEIMYLYGTENLATSTDIAWLQ